MVFDQSRNLCRRVSFFSQPIFFSMNKGLTKVVCGAWSTFFGQTVGKDSKDLTRGEPDDDSDIIPSRVHKGVIF